MLALISCGTGAWKCLGAIPEEFVEILFVAAALTVMLLSLPPRCQQNCVDLTESSSLVCSCEKKQQH